MNNLVEVSNLTKKYEGKIVLDNISLTIPEGRIIGLLGANGAGKTTLIKILAGVMQDYSGKVLIDNHNPGPYTKSILSYLPDKTYLSTWMNVKDTVDLFADFYTDFDKNKAIELLKLLNIEINQNVTKLSKGTYEKVQLIIVMSRRSKLYVLDEPLGGVDPASRDIIIDTILTNYSEKSSVLLSTQLIQDVERAFDSVIILKDNHIFVNDEVDNIRAKFGKSIDELCREVFKCC
ncbi:ABC transporter ATP-binding protein [Clostridium lacusfryxellense]|uniref:ABC transporter ATP-binding protein n=1 Tax=Clostridium lacusfryxellense TaxID=205328 RepID=UPI001C0D688C|nr:ABC transporter ATP-binding protein [Clostridium lacusfryxellense]MBU3112240.1 ABC transporter ATP-binding protein [Clostridium lacusfryxellense]